MIPVSKPFMPPLEELNSYMKDIWQSAVVTNNGPLVKLLEQKLRDYFKVKHALLVTNGTVALELAIQAMALEGEVITSPLSYVAAISSLERQGVKPIFADIDPDTMCLDPMEVERLITPNTSAILPTHIYGNACDVEAFEQLGEKYNLRVIYDAAHAFGSYYKNKSLASYGDVATISTHAYKVLHTIEGGIIVTDDDDLAERIFELRYFGYDVYGNYKAWGTNGKTSELHAAVGLCNFKYLDEILKERKRITHLYEDLLKNLPLKRPVISDSMNYNCAYFPILCESETDLLAIELKLAEQNIQTRRYFYPSLNQLDIINDNPSMPISESIAQRILCLPLYHGLSDSTVEKIVKIVKVTLQRHDHDRNRRMPNN